MFKKRSKAFFTSIILATIYLIYIISYFYGILGDGDTAEQIGSGLATALVTPHIIVLAISVMFGWLAFGLSSSGFALTASILYTVAGVMFIPYIFFVIPSIILGFVGYANQKNINNKAKAKRRVKVHKKPNANNKTNLKA
ncbi:benzylsuccinate synthase [Clostridium sporogenes]|uniref:benzylsuccinate synthase n=1 Tax=Clostridium sporogenes TaxID=1509 RepID=UPI0013D1E3DB|nr:benzylsuccinate synthase [Clostridium sporogenes]NFG95638.1 benzylsuccinate synthase [Clostridium sporogenes]NFH32719.1 benzylsuccinate synthase [Clostridium sporogenes]NFL18873.1 benzylsuccinate synthase [Clostridium sporogenes]NFN71875.1 benzylsuccinate synthase [Clostridium sporogenes]NFV21275.1 benzylsuccinate synthase [Clostridium sporogenes]